MESKAMNNNKLQLTDQNGELLLKCEVGDKYHQMILEVGLNKILKDAVEHWEKDDADETTYTVKVEEYANGGALINLPDELLEQMGWKEGDDIEIEGITNCFDWGEVPSLILRNLTKEKPNE